MENVGMVKYPCNRKSIENITIFLQIVRMAPIFAKINIPHAILYLQLKHFSQTDESVF